MNAAPRWDIFCTVVDNFGDIGVAWRLARQLAAEHGRRVRLWVDDLASFARLAPALDPVLRIQDWRGIEVRHWRQPFTPADLPLEAAEVVIEAFACELPQAYVDAMASRPCQPVWINLEYLSAETWVRGCHGLSSPHPRLPLTKHFFFPGFFDGTGGLIREHDLLQQRDAFVGDRAAQARFWADLRMPGPRRDEWHVSLFSYHNDALAGLLSAWSEAPAPVVCLVPEGPAAAQAAAWFGRETAAAGDMVRRGALELRILPFVEQERYDRLLWACDCNFVRGEDSFVRAQWAGKPLLWHIYPQGEDAHWLKLEAFLHRYCAALAPGAADAVRALHLAWNRGEAAAAAWGGWWQHRDVLAAHAARWCSGLAQRRDLAAALVEFCDLRLQ